MRKAEVFNYLVFQSQNKFVCGWFEKRKAIFKIKKCSVLYAQIKHVSYFEDISSQTIVSSNILSNIRWLRRNTEKFFNFMLTRYITRKSPDESLCCVFQVRTNFKPTFISNLLERILLSYSV